MKEYPSKLIEEAVNQISRLPGIGKKTALRLALYLLKQNKSYSESLATAIVNLRNKIIYCKICHNISDKEICSICSSHKRDNKTICVVEESKDIISIENTGQYNGLYHVLGGKISPIDGIAPDDLSIKSLEERVRNNDVKEIIMALSSTIEGDTTVYYIYKRLNTEEIKFSVIARGISIGDELDYIDEVTLGRSILNRTSYVR